MRLDPNRRRKWLSWLFVGALFALCVVLGVLQYRWIGEVSVAARDRLHAALQMNLVRLSQDFNSEIASSCRSLLPAGGPGDNENFQRDIEARFEQWKKMQHGAHLFRRIGLVVPRDGTATLEILDQERGAFQAAEWPVEWEGMRQRLEARFGPMAGPPMGQSWGDDAELAFEVPIFASEPLHRPPFRRDMAWMIFDLNLPYVRDVILPEVLPRHLETSGGTLAYDVAVLTRSKAPSLVYESYPKAAGIVRTADGSIGLLELRIAQSGRGGRGGRGPGPPDSGRWQLFVRHRAGSLDAVVAQTRWRNLGVTGGVLLLLVATVGALVRFTRNAERLAHLQMDFVAGVSHEIRTPLTALYTAGHNLRGRVAQNPAQVERYGEMIQRESGRLRDLVEQVLCFAGASAGRVIQEPAPVSVESVIADSMALSGPALQAAHCTVEKSIEPELPMIMGDPLALKHAMQNLVANAVKYGGKDHPWIGISASGTRDHERPMVEIRVADRGPGIPEDEQAHIFDAFFRGRRAIQEQIHGAGLGLNLVKKIVEAHGGSIRVKSAPEQGAEFIVRIPACPAGAVQ